MSAPLPVPTLQHFINERRLLARIRWAGLGLLGGASALYLYGLHVVQVASLSTDGKSAGVSLQTQSPDSMWVWVSAAMLAGGLLAICHPRLVLRFRRRKHSNPSSRGVHR